MKKILSIVRTCLISCVFLASATAVTASTTSASPQSDIQTIIQSLNLTEEQKFEVSDLIDEFRENLPKINIENVKATKKKQLMLLTQPEFDEAAMGELIDQVQAKQKEFLLREMRLKNSIYNVLTEEQKEKFKTSVKEHLMGEASQ